MSPLNLAIKYLDILCSGKNMDALHDLFRPNFTLEGPFYEFKTGADYIDASPFWEKT